ncbi:O-methyltransferase [Sediminibacterium sp.]|uniref:O-methyltransferase n=1 Tax=Sediminibacterium sp. TaxID=1917865 RepID=UPI003F722AC0
MELISHLVETYTAQFTSPEPEDLKLVNQATQEKHPHAHMISGHVQGQFLTMVCGMIKPKYVLEIGTFTGYSALCLLKGLPEDGIIHTIEIRPEDAATAAENFSKLNANKQITLHIGDASKIINQLPYQWDLVFIDADKTGYISYYEMIVPLLSAEGIIIVDNVLFHGQVLENPLKGKNAKAVHAFNQHVLQDARTEQVMLSIRDGLTIIKKKKGS